MQAADQFDLVIVGGGINGCMLARSAARAGLSTALVEKLDFGAGVTSRSTRLIHGGLRYLERFHLRLVRESLRDRESLLSEFPGMVQPQPFLLPAYSGDSRRPAYLAAGLALYRLLSPASRLPPPAKASASATLAHLPGLEPGGLLCGFEYADSQATYPERLALEAALQAEEAGAQIRNHTRATGFVLRKGRVAAVRVESPSGEGELRCRTAVNAAGAWADRVLGLLPVEPPERQLSLVNGAHIVVRDMPGSPRHAVYREARSDGRPFFIVPWRGLYLIGTTEIPFDGSPDDALPTEREARYLLDETNRLFPDARLGMDDVLYGYSGSRPLMRSGSARPQEVSRGHAVVDHERAHRVAGLYSMVGGKLTTARSFANEALAHVLQGLGQPAHRAEAPPSSPAGTDADPRIARTYGPRAPALRQYLQASPDRNRPLAAGAEATRGEVAFAVEREHAATLGDILLRRTGLAFDAAYEPAWAREAAAVAAPLLGWDEARKQAALGEFSAELAKTLWRP